MTKRPLWLWVGVGALALTSVSLWRMSFQERDEPISVVAQLQTIGELRTSRSHSSFVQEVSSSWEPAPEWQWVPGLAAAGRAATQNQAVMTISSQVDAVIDLAKAEVRKEGDSSVLVVPGAYLSEPVVKGKLNTHKAGLLWKDDSLALTGLERARETTIRSAREIGLMAKAEEEAAALIGRISASSGGKIEKICFQRSGGAWEDCRDAFPRQ